MNLKEIAKKLKLEIPTLYYAIKHPKTCWLAKLLALITVGYALSPLDLIPDFIFILGILDDLLILPGLLFLTLKLIPQEIIEECRQQATLLLAGQLSKKWIYSLPILVIWLLLIFLFVRFIL